MNTNSSDKHSGNMMKIVVIGGTGLIGKKVVNNLRDHGHEVVAASPSTGVNTLTGEGLAQALAGAQVVVDVANSPSFEDDAAMAFFETSGRNLFPAESAAGVRHHVALSVVGTDRLQESGYFRAKLAQENLIKASGIPYTIVRATQFFEFSGAIAQAGIVGEAVHLPPALFQPIASDDVADAVSDAALAAPLNGMIEVAGPERVGLDELVRRFLIATKDPHEVVTDPNAPYFGSVMVDDRTLTPGADPRIGPTFFEDWMRRSLAQQEASAAESAAPKPSHAAPAAVAGAVLLFLAALAALLFVGKASAHDIAVADEAKVTVVFDRPLPNVPGKSMRGVLVEYAPGAANRSHRHPDSAFIYATVLQGAIRSQVNDGPVTVYRVGESWSEAPGDHHKVSANASKTEPARLLAVFVVDTHDTELVRPD